MPAGFHQAELQPLGDGAPHLPHLVAKIGCSLPAFTLWPRPDSSLLRTYTGIMSVQGLASAVLDH